MIAVSVVQSRFQVVQSSLGDCRGKNSAGEYLTCDVKTLRGPSAVISGVCVQLEGELELAQCGLERQQ
jgi:hypothetical protein